MKNLPALIFVLALFFISGNLSAESLPDKYYEFDYGDDIYHVTIESDATLHWKCVEGMLKHMQGDEEYSLQKIADDIFFIVWKQGDDTVNSSVLNLREGEVKTFLADSGTLKSYSGRINVEYYGFSDC